MGCLNLNNPEVIEWVNSVGLDETYRQYLSHNYALPKYKAYLQKGAYAGLNREQVKSSLLKILNPDAFEFDVIEKILDQAPDAQAAFWKNTFYFANKANSLQVNEEAFHAIFQTLTSLEDRKVLYTIGESLLQERAKKSGKTVQQLIKNYSASNKLQGEELYKYILEEEVAKKFVNWYTYDNQLVTEQSIKDLWKNKDESLSNKLYQTLVNLFKKLADLIRGYNNNKEFLETYFSNIKEGKYKLDNPIFTDETLFPSLSTVKLFATESGAEYIMDSVQQNLMYSKMLALAYQIAEKTNKEINQKEIIEIAIDAYIQHMSDSNIPNSQDVIFSLEEFEGDVGEARPTVAKDLLQRFVNLQEIEETVFDDISEEEGEAKRERAWDEEANTVDHFTSLSKKIKAIMQVIQIPIYDKKGNITTMNYSFKSSNNVEYNLEGLEISRVADPNKIYAAVVRATSNAGTEIEKFRNLLLFTQDSQLNTDTKAFVDWTFNKIFGDNAYKAKEAILDRSTTSVVDLVKKGQENYYLSLVKAFDLWTRPSKIYEFSLEDGFFKSFNPNMTNVKSIQLDKWEKKWRELKDGFLTIENVGKINSYLKDIVFEQNVPVFSENEDPSKISAYKSLTALDLTYKSLGVELSQNYLKYVVSKVYIEKLNLAGNLPKDFLDVYDSFLLEDSEIDTDLFSLKSALKGQDSFDIEQVYLRETDDETGEYKDKGFVSKFEKAALGNAIFDESVLATSYLDADNKRRYAHQVKTFALRFLGSVVKDNKKIEDHKNEVKLLSAESEIFQKDNEYLKFIESLNPKEKNRLKFSSYGGAQLKDRTGGTKLRETVNEISSEDFVVIQANSVIDSVYQPRKEEQVVGGLGIKEEVNKKLSTNYFTGFVEASNTLTMFTGKWYNDTADSNMVTIKQGTTRKPLPGDVVVGDMAINMAYDLIKQQVDRIKAVDSKIRSLINTQAIANGPFEINLTPKKLRELGFKEDIIQSYHTGIVHYKKENGAISLDIEKMLSNKKKLPRAFTITNSLDGYFSDEAVVYNHFFNDLENRTKINDSIAIGLNTLLDDAYNTMASERNLSKDYSTNTLDPKARRLGFLQNDEDARDNNTTKKINIGKFFFNSMFNREHFHRAAFGDSAVINKNDITDQSKRFKGFEGQMLSVKTHITDAVKGVLEPLLRVRYVTEVASAKDPSDKNVSGIWDGVNEDEAKVDQDDAQSRTTVQFTRSYLHGLDRLSTQLVWVLDKVQNGTEFTQKEQEYIKKNKLYLAVEKSRGFGPQQDIKHGVQILRKLETSLKNEVTESIGLEEIQKNVNVTYTLNGESYFVTPREKATRELTLEYDTSTYDSYEEAYDANDLKVFEWTAKSNYLHTRRKMMEGWRTVNGVETYNATNEFDLLSPTTAHKRRIVNVLEDISELNATGNTFVQSLDAEYYGRQVENPGKEAITDPSQQIEIITSSLSDKIKFVRNGKVEEVSKDVIVKRFQSLLAKRDSTNILGAIEELKDIEGNPNLKLFYESIIDTLAETGGDRQLIESFATMDGKPKVNGNLPFIKNKLEQYLFAHYSKGVLVQKRDGDAKAMVSPRGQIVLKRKKTITVNGKKVVSWDSIPSNTPEYNTYFNLAASNRLEEGGYSFNGLSSKPHQNTLLNKISSLKDGDYFTDELRFNVPVMRNGVVQYFTETMMPKYHPKQNSIEDTFRFLTGVRIPSQDKSTSANLMIVDFLDISGSNTIIAAKEIQHLSGADYDIDKIYTTYAEGYWDGNSFKLYDKSFEDYKKYIFKKNKTLGKIYKKSVSENKRLPQIDRILDEVRFSLAGYTPENFKEDVDRMNELENTFSSANKYATDLYERRKEAMKKHKLETHPEVFALDRAIRLFETKREVNRVDIESMEAELLELKEMFKDAAEYTSTKEAEVFSLLKEQYNIIQNLRNEALKTLKLPTTEAEYLKYYSNGEYNAIVNNELLELSFELLTSNKEAYSNITSVEPLRNIDKDSKLKGLNIISRAREAALVENPFSKDASFDEDPKIPYHSVLFDNYYKKRIKASQTGIGAAVNANLTYLLLSRLGVVLDDNFKITYKKSRTDEAETVFSKFGEYMPSFPNQPKDKFVSDWISTVISVTTDEAKEGILAKYNLQGDILKAFVTGLQIGMHPEMLIALLNNKTIQNMNSESARDPLALEPTESLSSTLTKALNGFDADVESDVLTDEVLIQGLIKKSTSNDYAVFSTVKKLLVIAEQNSDTVKVMRVKRGFAPTYTELVDVLKSVKRLALGGRKYEQEHYPYVSPLEIHTAYDLSKYSTDENIKQFTNYVDNVLPSVYESVGNVLIEGSKTYIDIVNSTTKFLKIPDYKRNDLQRELLNAFIGHTLSVINKLPLIRPGQRPDALANRQMGFTINPTKDDVVGENTIAKEYEELIKMPKIYNVIKGSPIFSRLLVKTAEKKLSKTKATSAIDTISLNVFSKLSPEVQSDMMDDFAKLTQFNPEATEEEDKVRTFLLRLLNYYAGKDGLGFSPTSVSKMFAPVYFTDISNYFDHILKNQPIDPAITRGVINRFVTDIRNIDYLPTIPFKKEDMMFQSIVDVKYLMKGSLVKITTDKQRNDMPAYYRQTTHSGTKENSILKYVFSDKNNEHYYLEYPAIGHKDYKSSVIEGRFTFQPARKNQIITNLGQPLPMDVPQYIRESINDLIKQHTESLSKISDVSVAKREEARQELNLVNSVPDLIQYFNSLIRDKQAAASLRVRDKRIILGRNVFYNSSIYPQDSNFNTKRKVYVGNIESLSSNEVFVFGANDKGDHGAGAAGVAMGQQRKLAEVRALPDGTKGKWAVKGEHSMISEGLEGKSYGLVTVVGEPGNKTEKNRISPDVLQKNIKAMYAEAVANPKLVFYIGYDAANITKKNLSGYTPLELATVFSSIPIPPNIRFEESFNTLINQLTGLENMKNNVKGIDLSDIFSVEELLVLFKTYSQEEQKIYKNQFSTRRKEIEDGLKKAVEEQEENMRDENQKMLPEDSTETSTLETDNIELPNLLEYTGNKTITENPISLPDNIDDLDDFLNFEKNCI